MSPQEHETEAKISFRQIQYRTAEITIIRPLNHQQICHKLNTGELVMDLDAIRDTHGNVISHVNRLEDTAADTERKDFQPD